MYNRNASPAVIQSFQPLITLIVWSFCLLFFTSTASAEFADKDKPINVEADRVTVNDATQESVFEGNVVVTQGTLVLQASKMIIKQSDDGFQRGTAYGDPAHFKQKREGLDEYIQGFGERIEYDGKTDKIQLFTNAQVTRGADVVNGDYISYDAATEYFQVSGNKKSADGKPAGGRVHAVIQPKSKTTTK